MFASKPSDCSEAFNLSQLDLYSLPGLQKDGNFLSPLFSQAEKVQKNGVYVCGFKGVIKPPSHCVSSFLFIIIFIFVQDLY